MRWFASKEGTAQGGFPELSPPHVPGEAVHQENRCDPHHEKDGKQPHCKPLEERAGPCKSGYMKDGIGAKTGRCNSEQDIEQSVHDAARC